MSKYYIYHCSISEIDIEENKITPVFEAHTDDENNKAHLTKEDSILKLRGLLDVQSQKPLFKEIKHLKQIIHLLDRKLANASS